MAESAVYLQARVIQKVATEAEWQDINLDPLIDGELYLYRDVDGTPRNFKIGNGVNQPRDIPYFFDASMRVPFFGTATTSSTPSPASGSGFWIATEAGTYTNYGGVVLPANSFGIITRVGTTYGILIATIDLSGYLAKNEITKTSVGKNEVRLDLRSIGNMASTGVITNIAGSETIYGQSVIGGQQYTISGFQTSTGRNAKWLDANGTQISVVPINANYPLPTTVTAPSNAVKVDYTIRSQTAQPDVSGTIQWEKGAVATSYQAPQGLVISQIDGSNIQATSLSSNNIVPNATLETSAVNLGQLNSLVVKKTDIVTEQLAPTNLFPVGTIVNDRVVLASAGENQGQVVVGANQKLVKIPIEAGKQYRIREMGINASYSSFFADEALTTLVKFNGSQIKPAEKTVSTTAGSGATWLAVNIKTDTTDDSIYADTFIYEISSTEVVSGITIDGVTKDIKGGVSVQQDGGASYSADKVIFEGAEVSLDDPGIVRVKTQSPFDQSLNTTDSVSFEGVTTSDVQTDFLAALGVSLDLDVWDGTGTAPIPVGGIYVTPDGTIKRRMS